MDSGALVRTIYPNGPAGQAGLAQGDIIVGLDGQQITSMDELVLQIRNRQVGDKVKITYYRGSDKKDTDVTLTAKTHQHLGASGRKRPEEKGARTIGSLFLYGPAFARPTGNWCRMA